MEASTTTEFEQIADELYALKPDGFAAARDEHVKRLKAAGERPLANEVAKLRRPTQSAWLVNLLWRDQHDVMEQLFELASDLSGAQARASGTELRELTQQRRAIETALLTRARAIGSEQGVSLTPEQEREVQETLAAALAQPEAADEVRTGRLVKPIEYAGFGAFPSTTAAPSKARDSTEPAREPTPLRKPTEEDRKEREARERVQAAQRAAIEAAAALEGAKRDAAERESAVGATRQRLEQVSAELERLRKEERELEDKLSDQERSSREARRQLEDAQREHAAAVREMEKSERDLAELKQ